jgi:hypothetical protein
MADPSPRVDLDPPEICAVIESSRPLRSAYRVAGPGIVFAKRVVRRLLAWYVAPIAVDQTRFNLSLLRDLRALERRLDTLERASKSEPDGEAPPGWASVDR